MEDQSVPKPVGEMPSPGPLKMSDLDASAHEGHLPPPRRLEPLGKPTETKKRKRTKKRDRPSAATESVNIPPTASLGTPALLGESMLSQLRSRLDPIYNPPPSSSSLPPARLPPLESSTSEQPHISSLSVEEREAGIEDNGSERASEHSVESQKGARRRTKQNRERTSRDQSPPVHEEVTREQVSEQPEEEELKSISREALIDNSLTGSDRKKRKRKTRSKRKVDEHDESGDIAGGERMEMSEVTRDRLMDSTVHDDLHPPHDEGVSGPSRGRQLPALPDSVEDMQETTMADEIAATGGIPATRGEFVHPNDPQFLVAEEDIAEVAPDELHGTTRLFLPTLQPHPSTSEAKEVIFVERKDGRGFIAQKKDAASRLVEVEQGFFSGEREITPSQFATLSHRATQHLAFIAHGLVAGVSLWDCVVSNVLSRETSNRHVDLLTFYHPLTLPVNAVYVFLLSLIMLSLLDRFDFATLNKQCLHSFFKTPVQIIVLIATSLIFLALTITLSVAAIDERIALYPHQPSLWVDLLSPINITASPSPATPLPTTHTVSSLSLVYILGNNLVSSRVTPWLALAIVRAICCCISWMLVVWTSDFDRLLEYLRNVQEISDISQTVN